MEPRTTVRCQLYFERTFHERMFAIGLLARYRDINDGPLQEVPMSEASLTGKRRRILEFIAESIRERGYPPSVREIGEAVGLTSPSTCLLYTSRCV